MSERVKDSARKARLAEALRANLHRRKAQAGRKPTGKPVSETGEEAAAPLSPVSGPNPKRDA